MNSMKSGTPASVALPDTSSFGMMMSASVAIVFISCSSKNFSLISLRDRARARGIPVYGWLESSAAAVSSFLVFGLAPRSGGFRAHRTGGKGFKILSSVHSVDALTDFVFLISFNHTSRCAHRERHDVFHVGFFYRLAIRTGRRQPQTGSAVMCLVEFVKGPTLFGSLPMRVVPTFVNDPAGSLLRRSCHARPRYSPR